MKQQDSFSIKLIDDGQLQALVDRHMATLPRSNLTASPRTPYPSHEATYQSLKLFLETAELSDEQRKVLDALPHPIILYTQRKTAYNAALRSALDSMAEGIGEDKDHPMIRALFTPKALADLLMRIKALGSDLVYLPLGDVVYEVKGVSFERGETILYFLPAVTWAPKLTIPIRLSICLRLSGLLNKQLPQLIDITLGGAQHISRYYKEDLLALRRLITEAKPL